MKGYEIGLSSMICVDQEIALGPAAKAGDKKQVPAIGWGPIMQVAGFLRKKICINDNVHLLVLGEGPI